MRHRFRIKSGPIGVRRPRRCCSSPTKQKFYSTILSHPKNFTKVADGVYARPRQFDIHLLATFPAFGPPATIVIGLARNTDAKTSTPWLITLMHEHFHQLQDGKPGYHEGVAQLGLSGNDTTGMWMLNYPFPHERPEVMQSFAQLRDMLVSCLAQTDSGQFEKVALAMSRNGKKAFARLAPNDRKYLSFQLWQEGIARYTQIKAAEVAVSYQPTAEYAALPDYESLAAYAKRARAETLEELGRADIGKMKRSFVYPFGAAEGL